MHEEAGINFAPKILRRSQSLSRGVTDLMNWDRAKEMKKDIKKEAQEQLSSRKVPAMCPGSRALLDNIGYTHRLEDLLSILGAKLIPASSCILRFSLSIN